MKSIYCALAALAVSLVVVPFANAISIGNWNGSGRSWNNGDFTDIKATMIGAGNTVLPDSAISPANLAGVNMYIIGEATLTPTPAEILDLKNFVQSGNCLLIFTNSSFSGGTGGNAVLAGIGSSMSFASDFVNATGPLQGGNFATTGPPYNIVGQNLVVSPGNTVSGGNTLYGVGLHYEAIGSGYVFAFGDRYEHNFATPSQFNTNGQLFLNIAEAHAVPEPTAVAFAGITIATLALFTSRRQRSACRAVS